MIVYVLRVAATCLFFYLICVGAQSFVEWSEPTWLLSDWREADRAMLLYFGATIGFAWHIFDRMICK